MTPGRRTFRKALHGNFRRTLGGDVGGILRGALACILLTAAGGTGCAAAGGAPEGEPAQGPTSDEPTFRLGDPLERDVVPFEVVGRDGSPHEFPFLGGFDVPRPQLVDIDGDGTLDLFLQKYRDELMLFENTGTPTSPELEWRNSNYRGFEVGEWARFHDIDGDGDPDLFMEFPSSYIRFVENVGTPTEPEFRVAEEPVRDPEGNRVFADAQNIPFLIDVDCNGRSDLFLGRIDGTVARYELDGFEGGVPVFALVTERFEDIEIVAAFGVPGGPVEPGGEPGGRPGEPSGAGEPGSLPGEPSHGAAEPDRPSLHGANSMAFADWNGDGAPDLFWGDFFEPGLLLIENIGTCPRPNLRVEPEAAPADPPVATSGYNAPALADLDGDGNLDLLVGVLGGAFNPNHTASDNLLHYRGTSDGTFGLETRRFLDGIDVGSEAVPALGDLDGDGDPDLLIGSKIDPETSVAPPLHWYENVGSAQAPRFEYRGALDEPAHLNGAPVLVDFEGDGRLDLLVGSFGDGVVHYRNVGTPAEPRFERAGEEPIATLPRGSYSAPAAGDLDGDGLLDLVVGESSGELNHFRNVGTPEEPGFEIVSEQLGGIDVGSRSSPLLADTDGDGDLDLLVGEEGGRLVHFENTGSASAPEFGPEGTPLDGRFPRLAAPRLVDLDGDGALDLVLGDQGGGLVLRWNRRGSGEG